MRLPRRPCIGAGPPRLLGRKRNTSESSAPSRPSGPEDSDPLNIKLRVLPDSLADSLAHFSFSGFSQIPWSEEQMDKDVMESGHSPATLKNENQELLRMRVFTVSLTLGARYHPKHPCGDPIGDHFPL